MDLTGPQKEQFQDALTSAFRSYIALRRMLNFELNENLNTICESRNIDDCVFELIEKADSDGWLLDLFAGAVNQNPGNKKLKSFIDKMGANFFLNEVQTALNDLKIGLAIKVLKVLPFLKSNQGFITNLLFRWDSLVRKEKNNNISAVEVENDKSIILTSLISFLDYLKAELGDKGNFDSTLKKFLDKADNQYFVLYPYLKKNITYAVEFFDQQTFDCIHKCKGQELSLNQALEKYGSRIKDLLKIIVEMAQRYAGNYNNDKVLYRANIMLIVNAKDQLARQVIDIYQERFFFHNDILVENLLGILYLPEQFVYQLSDENSAPLIALPIHRPKRHNDFKTTLPGAPFAALHEVSILRDVVEMQHYVSEKVKQEMQDYFSHKGLGKGVKSIASFRIGTNKNPIGVLNIDANVLDILGDQPEFYQTFKTNLDPILMRVSNIIEQFAQLYVKQFSETK